MPPLRRATAEDAADLAALVDRAYDKYVARIGHRPLPMTADYQEVVRRDIVWIAKDQDNLVAAIVLVPEPGSARLCIENIAVEPHWQGIGLGRHPMSFAEQEARRLEFGSIYLYTNEAMTENIRFYKALGYQETHRTQRDGRCLVFMQKELQI